MKQSVKNIIKLSTFIVLMIGLIWELNHIFFYHDQSIWSTDKRVTCYRELPDNSLDVLFLGSSNLMSGINPIQLWAETGIQSYNYCSRAQTFPFSYEYLRDALKTQLPRCVVLDALSIFLEKSYNGLADHAFHFSVNMDNLSLTSKLDLLDPYVSKEDRLSYVFPLLKNHNYYKTWENVKDETEQIFMGYCFVDSNKSYDTPVYTNAVSPMEDIDDLYLRKIIDLCQEYNIDLYVIKTPVAYSDEAHSILNHVKNVCEEYGVTFYDMMSDFTSWGFDYQTDMMDSTHINSTGAYKATVRIGSILKERYDFSCSFTHKYSSIWKNENNRMLAFRDTNNA